MNHWRVNCEQMKCELYSQECQNWAHATRLAKAHAKKTGHQIWAVQEREQLFKPAPAPTPDAAGRGRAG